MDFLPTGYTPKDNDSSSKYLKLKNDQYIIDRQSKPEMPETPLEVEL